MKLQIPRLHYKCLEEFGTLEEFVSTKKEDGNARKVLDKTYMI